MQTPSLRIGTAGAVVGVPPVRIAPAAQVVVPALPVAPPVEAPAVPVKPPAVPVKPPPLPVKPPAVPVKPPAVPVKPPAVPVKPPPLPVKPPAVPVKPPPVDLPSRVVRRSLPGAPPSLPAAPSQPGRSSPRGSAPIAEPHLRALPDLLGASGLSQTDAAASPAPAGSAGSVGALTEAIPGIARLPSRSELAKLPPALRRKLLRAAFDTPLRGQRLKRLRSAIRAHGSCLGSLPQRGRRTLELRAGLLGRKPASRRVIAHRMGTSPTAVLRIERSSLRRLLDASEQGLCGGGVAGAAIGGPSDGSPDDAGGAPSDEGGGGDPRPTSAVLADVHEGGPGIDLGDGKQGAAETLLFLLVTLFALLGPLAAAMVVAQRRASNGAAANGAGERPLLFLDVDGVIALDPLSDRLPPGRIRASPLGLAYVPDHAGELVRELATRFDIVWATGWEHHVNTGLLGALGLQEELPVLTFGKKARPGSSKWKIKRVDDYAGHRPAAWIDDHFVGRHERWAAHRPEPTLLVKVDSSGGLATDHVERLLRWADRVARSAATETNGQRQTHAR